MSGRLLARLAWRRWPLALRLTAAIFAAQLLLFVPGLVVYALLTSDLTASLEFVATEPDFRQSLQRDPDGGLTLRPNAGLTRHLALNPSLRIGAIDAATSRVARGSTPVLGEILSRMHDAGMDPVKLDTEDMWTPDGPVIAFYYADTSLEATRPLALWRVTRTMAWQFLPACLVASALAGLTVRFAFRPMREGARLLATVGLNRLDPRIAPETVPADMRPFTRTVNETLDRIARDVGAQRRFIANAAHELRTPVSVMGARVELLPDSETRRALLTDIDRIADMVAQLLALARLTDAEAPADDELRLEEIARDVIASYAPLAVARGRHLALEAHTPLPRPRGSRAAVESALSNLLDNAVHAEPQGGTVEVAVGPGATIRVADHGKGLAAAEREQAFEPFWRGDPSREGTGLGLAIVRAAMTLHRGAARATETPGGGATFVLTFPDS